MAVFVKKQGAAAPAAPGPAAVAPGAAGAAPPGTDAAASADTPVFADAPWVLVSLVAILVGIVIATRLFDGSQKVQFKAAEGLGAFALFYVVAQAAERATEVLQPVFELLPGLKKKAAVQEVEGATAAATSGSGTVQAAADAKAALDQIRANRQLFGFALTGALGVVACGYLKADFLQAVGVSGAKAGFDLSVTALVIGGGSTKLHDLISNSSKASAAKSDQATEATS